MFAMDHFDDASSEGKRDFSVLPDEEDILEGDLRKIKEEI